MSNLDWLSTYNVLIGKPGSGEWNWDPESGYTSPDDQLSLVSKNPVQNKVITEKLNSVNSLAQVAMDTAQNVENENPVTRIYWDRSNYKLTLTHYDGSDEEITLQSGSLDLDAYIDSDWVTSTDTSGNITAELQFTKHDGTTDAVEISAVMDIQNGTADNEIKILKGDGTSSTIEIGADLSDTNPVVGVTSSRLFDDEYNIIVEKYDGTTTNLDILTGGTKSVTNVTLTDTSDDYYLTVTKHDGTSSQLDLRTGIDASTETLTFTMTDGTTKTVTFYVQENTP